MGKRFFFVDFIELCNRKVFFLSTSKMGIISTKGIEFNVKHNLAFFSLPLVCFFKFSLQMHIEVCLFMAS